MKPKLRIEVVPFPTANAQRDLDACLDVLADALADRLIAKARAAVAAELGLDEERIDREAGRAAREASDVLSLARIGEAP